MARHDLRGAARPPDTFLRQADRPDTYKILANPPAKAIIDLRCRPAGHGSAEIMPGMEYAIVDIETTGGYASGSGITEIAIVVHDGRAVVDRFETLVHPGYHIPLHIQTLTGITNDMVANSPSFAELAPQIHDWLKDRVFVAHNVNFDLSFLTHYFQLEGLDFRPAKLCTVRLSRRIWPGLASYSLGNLCRTLEIPLHNRHRAAGDAEATAILFSRLLAEDREGIIPKMLKRRAPERQLPPNLPREAVDTLPHKPGVYYFLDRAGKVLYVGKAKDLHKRVTSHFSGHSPLPQRQQFLRHIYSLRHETCGSELMAFLLEAVEIRRLWPPYNRAMKRFEPRFGLHVYEDQEGYQRLAIGRLQRHRPGIHVFYWELDGVNLLHKLARAFGLCPQMCSLGPCPDDCSCREDGKRLPPDLYNARVNAALRDLDERLPTYAVLDEGRHAEERSCIWIEKGRFYGMGYISRHTDLQDPLDVRGLLTPYEGNHYMMQLVQAYAEKNPQKVLRIAPLAATASAPH